jgi:ATP-binding cassette subfamily C protein CydD
VALSSQTIDIQKLESALAAAESLKWVNDLPDGWNTQIGERGYGISTGQIQRIAIARAFYKDAPLLILDEPTSALDPLLEDEMYAAIRRLISYRTVITIAHRLPTIYQSDRILFIKEGKIIETGTHTELMKLGQEYSIFVRNYQHATK